MTDKKFDPKKIAKLNDPRRAEFQNPDLIWDTLGLPAARVLVDVGAGTGFFAMPFCDRMAQGKVYACDTSDVMIDWLRQNLPEKYKGRIVPMKTAENEIDLADGIADLVYMMNLHHELDAPLLLLSEVKRLLKSGGCAVIIDWKKEEMPFGPPLKIRVDAECIENQLRRSGFIEIASHDILKFNSFLVATRP